MMLHGQIRDSTVRRDDTAIYEDSDTGFIPLDYAGIKAAF